MTHTQADENNTEKDYVFTFAGGLLLLVLVRLRGFGNISGNFSR